MSIICSKETAASNQGLMCGGWDDGRTLGEWLRPPPTAFSFSPLSTICVKLAKLEAPGVYALTAPGPHAGEGHRAPAVGAAGAIVTIKVAFGTTGEDAVTTLYAKREGLVVFCKELAPGDEPAVSFEARKGDVIVGFAAYTTKGVWRSEPTRVN